MSADSAGTPGAAPRNQAPAESDPRVGVAARFTDRLTRDTLAIVLAGGRGTRLHELTHSRAKPAVPFGAKLRIIDFALSNCVNSGIRHVAVLTQYQPYSLIRHIHRAWGFLQQQFGEFVELFPAAQHRTESNWYAGTADAVYQNLELIRVHGPNLVLVLAGDHVYKMDYAPMLVHHVTHAADVTVGCIEVPLAEAHGLGVMGLGEADRVVRFVEKPAHPEASPDDPDHALASMGIYVFDAGFLAGQLERDARDARSSHDFGRNLLPELVASHRVIAYRFRDGRRGGHGYWRDIGTLDAYWKANMELLDVVPEINLYDQQWPVWTCQEQLPAAKFVFDDDGRRGMAVDSMVSAGCIVSGATVRRSVLSNGVRVDDGAHVESCVILPHSHVGANCRLRKVIVDEGCRVPAGSVIGHDRETDSARFRVSAQGVVLVTAEMLGQTPVVSR